MGKAKRKLNKARKEYFKSFEESDDKEYVNICENDYELNYDIKLEITSNNIREYIFDYVRENSLPICEFLDIDNMKNYINWLIKKS